MQSYSRPSEVDCGVSDGSAAGEVRGTGKKGQAIYNHVTGAPYPKLPMTKVKCCILCTTPCNRGLYVIYYGDQGINKGSKFRRFLHLLYKRMGNFRIQMSIYIGGLWLNLLQYFMSTRQPLNSHTNHYIGRHCPVVHQPLTHIILHNSQLIGQAFV